MEVLKKIIDRLPFPVVVAMVLIGGAMWFIKEYNGWESYQYVFKNKLFLTIFIFVCINVAGFYLSKYLVWSSHKDNDTEETKSTEQPQETTKLTPPQKDDKNTSIEPTSSYEKDQSGTMFNFGKGFSWFAVIKVDHQISPGTHIIQELKSRTSPVRLLIGLDVSNKFMAWITDESGIVYEFLPISNECFFEKWVIARCYISERDDMGNIRLELGISDLLLSKDETVTEKVIKANFNYDSYFDYSLGANINGKEHTKFRLADRLINNFRPNEREENNLIKCLSQKFGNPKKAYHSESDSVSISIAPMLRGNITPFNIINSEFTLVSVVKIGNSSETFEEVFFKVECRDYFLCLSVEKKHIVLKRNDQVLAIDLALFVNPKEGIILSAMCTPSRLLLRASGKLRKEIPATDQKYIENGHTVVIDKETSPVVPPLHLLEWARKNNVSPIILYDDYSDFKNTIASALISIQDKIDNVGLHRAAWDIEYDQKTIISMEPKKESELLHLILGLLYDIAIAKNLDLTIENRTYESDLEFLFIGSLKNGERKSICVEFNLAHSKDLDHGIGVKLPEYMKSKACDFGIYCVLNFKGKSFIEPAQYKTDFDLQIHLHKLKPEGFEMKIKSIILDFSKPQSSRDL